MITLKEWKASGEEFAAFVRTGKQVDVEIVKDLTGQQDPKRRVESNRSVAYLKGPEQCLSVEDPLKASFVEVNSGVWVFEGYVRADGDSSIVYDSNYIVPLQQTHRKLEMLGCDVKKENNSGELKTITAFM